jgi:hypothetical protein
MSTPRETSPIRLRCLAGGALADDMLASARRLGKLSSAAVRDLGGVLRASVAPRATAELAQRLTQFCQTHQVPDADVGHVVRASRFLLREASAADLDNAGLESDARLLFEGSDDMATLLLAEYDAIKAVVRRELVEDALTKHGNVLIDVEWRVDVVASDRNVPRIATPIALVTFNYKTGDKSERLTLQITAEQLSKLQTTFAAVFQRTLRPLG